MKITNVLKNDYFRLFVKRESKVVLGRNYSTLWLLTAVLTATFLAIAFSNASLKYLSYKMDDPFINWVDIKNNYANPRWADMEKVLEEDYIKETYHFYDFQSDLQMGRMFYCANLSDKAFVQIRYFEHMNTPLVDAILNDDNIIDDWSVDSASDINEKTIGVIITKELMEILGYNKAPSYIYYQSPGCQGAEEFGFMVDTSSGNGWSPIPIPVLAVVERLPGNVDMIASTYQYEQFDAYENPFNLYFHAEDYAKDLHYFVPATVDYEEFSNDVNTLAKELTDVELDITNKFLYAPEIEPFKDGDFVTISADDVDYNIWKAINDEVLSIYGAKDVHRVFEYDFGRSKLPTTGFISIHFQDLDMLSEFEKYISSEYEVNIEMSQINAKQNFNAVSAMGNILSWAIIAFAIIAIILFIVNLLQSYFQKVKRNLGTFKAFGISNRDLISVYVLILGAIILAAVVLSVSVTWFIQGGLHICGILKDGMFDYLSLWSVKTVCSIAIIVVASVYTVGAVMHKLLKATPGDLIYDRQ